MSYARYARFSWLTAGEVLTATSALLRDMAAPLAARNSLMARTASCPCSRVAGCILFFSQALMHVEESHQHRNVNRSAVPGRCADVVRCGNRSREIPRESPDLARFDHDCNVRPDKPPTSSEQQSQLQQTATGSSRAGLDDGQVGSAVSLTRFFPVLGQRRRPTRGGHNEGEKKIKEHLGVTGPARPPSILEGQAVTRCSYMGSWGSVGTPCPYLCCLAFRGSLRTLSYCWLFLWECAVSCSLSEPEDEYSEIFRKL
ncbi:hypothetical protein N657DRAFT_228389 [Parathielavia appendiculata]|uniref:Uncharacterized protein n=1 Tax=Parathielavia appendiculata TaxID=2587402 RepID=A0AAN6U7D8_9PEZI|nr:hypothetical protein N657DRAFT_228389 [Parathielavia appendiculata]